MCAPPLVRSQASVDRIDSDLRLQWTETVCPKPWQALEPCSVRIDLDFEETVPTASDSQGRHLPLRDGAHLQLQEKQV